MQTFLPYREFSECAHVLDMKRLGKQRVEARQILRMVTTNNYFGAWKNHPAVKMWRQHSIALQAYYNAILSEWIKRGYRNTMEFEYWMPNGVPSKVCQKDITTPLWITDELVISHRSNLIRKNPNHYRQYWADIPDNIPYLWPVELVG